MHASAASLRLSRSLPEAFAARLNEAARFRVADDVVHQLQQHGDPWRLKDDLAPPSKWHLT